LIANNIDDINTPCKIIIGHNPLTIENIKKNNADTKYPFVIFLALVEVSANRAAKKPDIAIISIG